VRNFYKNQSLKTEVFRDFPTKILLSVFALLLASCSFDYGNQDGADKNQPDVVMDNVEYVRVRSGDPVARFQAEHAERFEERRLMALRNFTFEQFEKQTGDVNASGKVGSAEVNTDTGDIRMDDGVRIEVESEDIIILTTQLQWKDKERTLTGGSEDTVDILRENGTGFSGIGFSADARLRKWEFSGSVSGTYIHEESDEDEGAEGAGNAETGEEAETGKGPEDL
jgi:LPS export ABC transporter protein LptC